jgi:glycerol uptake operon antiterminator
MEKSEMLDVLECAPIIAAVQEGKWDDAINSPAKIIFSLRANLLSVRENIAEAHKNGKAVFIHVDLADGIGKDKVGLRFLADCGVDGIITTRGNLVRAAKELGLLTVQRIFALDSQGIAGVNEIVGTANPDFIEIMPGVIEKIIKRFAKGNVPVIAGGLIETKQEVTTALSAGAVAVSTGGKELWSL